MNRITIILLLLIFFFSADAQMLKKISIRDGNNESGCFVYGYCDFKFQTSYSEDSSLLYTGECSPDSVSYGLICIKLREPLPDLDASEEIVIKYLDFLKTNFSITKAAGYGKGHTLRNNENTRGVIDYWEDDKQNNWKVKAWTNNKYIVVLYAYSAKTLPDTKIDVYLNGLVFPGN